MHACFLVDKDLGLLAIDLGSKASTFIDGVKIENSIPMAIKSQSKIVFGLSTRTYNVTVDYTNMQRAVEIEKKNLEREMKMLEKLDDPNLDLDTLKSTLGLIK